MERHQPENILVRDSYEGGGAACSDEGLPGVGVDDKDNTAATLMSSVRAGSTGDGKGSERSCGAQFEVNREEIVSNLVELFKEVRPDQLDGKSLGDFERGSVNHTDLKMFRINLLWTFPATSHASPVPYDLPYE